MVRWLLTRYRQFKPLVWIGAVLIDTPENRFYGNWNTTGGDIPLPPEIDP